MSVDLTINAILAHHDQITTAERQRDELIREAVERGVRVVVIAEALGLTRNRIYQIVAKTKARRCVDPTKERHSVAHE